MRLNTSHRVIVALTGFAIGLRVLMPIHTPSRFGSQVDVAATLLQVVGILLLGAALFFILPFTWSPAAFRRMVGAGLTMGWLLIALVFAFGASKTGLVLSLEQTNWPLTTAAAVVVSLPWVARATRTPRASAATNAAQRAEMLVDDHIIFKLTDVAA